MNWNSFKEVAILVIGALLVLTMWMHDKDLDRNHEADLRDRAVSCRTQLGLGIPLAENCLDPLLRKYFDPEEVITTGAFRAQCHTLRQNNQPLPEGCPIEDE